MPKKINRARDIFGHIRCCVLLFDDVGNERVRFFQVGIVGGARFRQFVGRLRARFLPPVTSLPTLRFFLGIFR